MGKIAIKIDTFMKLNTHNVITISWIDFYKLINKKKCTKSMEEVLRLALKEFNLCITYGINAVVIHRDSNFNPIGDL